MPPLEVAYLVRPPRQLVEVSSEEVLLLQVEDSLVARLQLVVVEGCFRSKKASLRLLALSQGLLAPVGAVFLAGLVRLLQHQ